MYKESPNVKVYSFEEMLKSSGYVLYTCTGISMNPFIRQKKDIVEIRPLNGRANKYDVVLYKRGEKYILHRVLKVRSNDYVICGDHNIWREYGITDDQILGVLTRAIRDGKSIYPTDWNYKLYVHLWCDFYHVRAAILYSKMLIRAVRRRLKKLVKKVL